MENPLTFKQIFPQEAKEIMEQGRAIIVDIRGPEAYEESHIKKAILVTQETVEEFLKQADKTKSLICYCYHGISSQSAAEYFKGQGFQEVYSIKGGFEEWKKAFPEGQV